MKNWIRAVGSCGWILIGFGTQARAENLLFLTGNIDPTTKASVDFFQYANGGWIQKNPVPDSESTWGIGELVQEELYLRILTINEAAQKSKSSVGSTSQKIGDFWSSAMDVQAIQKAGLKPLTEDLKKIDALKAPSELTPLIADLRRDGVACLFESIAAQDDKASDHMIYQYFQGGLGLPNREYYFQNDARTEAIREAYLRYLSETLIALGSEKNASVDEAKEVFQLETKLARASKKLEDLRDPIANYHKLTLKELAETAPNFDWNSFSKRIGIPNPEASVLVGQPDFFKALSHEMKATQIATWKNYLRFHLVDSNASVLDDSTYGRYFNFRRSLTGATRERPRFKRMIDLEERSIGELLGQLFVKKYFNEKAKDRYLHLVEAVREAYGERIRHLSWMSEPTKTKALEKLGKISKKVGYPDRWKDFSSLTIVPDSFYRNTLAAKRFWFQYNLNKLGKPVDRTEWDLTPQTYNAYYNPSNNEIVLPAGMFTVPGMKDEDLDDGFVYGYAVASTIGHEITHGFDDQGRLYDSAGNLVDWWTKADELEFKKRTQSIVDQFNEFIPVDALHVNGEATQGENIADLGGVVLGVDAFKKTDAFRSGKKIAGFTPMQRFFLGYAYSWMIEEKKERLANQLMVDVHAPAKERVNGPLVNVPEFYEAFQVKKGDSMYRDESKRVSIW